LNYSPMGLRGDGASAGHQGPDMGQID